MKTGTRHLPLILGSVLAGLVGAGFVLGSTVGKESIYRYLNVFAEVYSLVRSNYVDPVDDAELIDGACKGVVGGLDPFSAYLSKDEFQALQKDPFGGPAATGLELLRIGGGAIIIAVRPGSPAEKAGLRPGDQVWSIEGTPARQMSLMQVRRAQRGPADSVAHILVYHPKTQKREDLHLRRAVLAGPAHDARLLEGKVGYLRVLGLDRFDRDPLRSALGSLRQKGASQLLLDLRDCAGGGVDDAVRFASLFVPPGTIVFVQERGGAKVAKASSLPAAWSLPVTVLLNGGSAGAAEIAASAMRSRLKTRILGETSYGLASVQDLVALPSGDGLILSDSKLLAPGGDSWSKGIKPDQEITATVDEHAGLEPDRQLEKALDLLRQEAAAKAA